MGLGGLPRGASLIKLEPSLKKVLRVFGESGNPSRSGLMLFQFVESFEENLSSLPRGVPPLALDGYIARPPTVCPLVYAAFSGSASFAHV